VLITLEINGVVTNVPAVVDSGADTTIFPAEALKPYGVDYQALAQGSQSIGAGGGFESRPCSGKVRYGQWSICENFLVCEPNKLKIALVGRQDFFDKFTVRFMWFESPPAFSLEPHGIAAAEGPNREARRAAQRGR
jgi:hypothetical protein